MTLATVAAEITYADVVGLIRKITHAVHAMAGIEFDELMAEANLTFCKFYREFDPGRGDFAKGISARVRFDLLKRVERESRWTEAGREVLEEMTYADGDFSVEEFVAALSSDAADAVRLALDWDDSISYHHRKRAVGKRLRREWGRTRTLAAFDEVKQLLEE